LVDFIFVGRTVSLAR